MISFIAFTGAHRRHRRGPPDGGGARERLPGGPQWSGAEAARGFNTPSLRYKIPVFSDPDPGKS